MLPPQVAVGAVSTRHWQEDRRRKLHVIGEHMHTTGDGAAHRIDTQTCQQLVERQTGCVKPQRANVETKTLDEDTAEPTCTLLSSSAPLPPSSNVARLWCEAHTCVRHSVCCGGMPLVAAAMQGPRGAWWAA